MNFVKKLACALTLFVATSVFALDPSVPNFLGANTSIFLTNNTTTLFGATNVEMVVGPTGPLLWSYNTNVILPTFVGGTTINGVNFGGTVYYTNAQTTLPGGQIAGAAWQDVNLWPNLNADSNIPAISLWINTTTDGGAGSTNLLTLLFGRMYGTNADSTSGMPNANTFTIAVPMVGSTNTVCSTNLPSVFQIGSTGIRLLSAKTANSTTNLFVRVNGLGLSGFRP